MSRRTVGLRFVVAAVLLQGAIALPAAAADPGTNNSAGDLKPADASTPTTAANDSDDRRVTEQIRQAVLPVKSFSELAQRVQIATNQSAVILRGAVRSAEVNKIETLAAQFAGTRQIDNQLTVAGQ